MSVVRFTQNFSRRRALVVSDDDKAIAVLSGTLAKLGLTVEPATTDLGEAIRAQKDAGTDVLFIDGDLDHSALLAPPDREIAFVPTVGLVGVEAPSRLRTLMLAGTTAFLRKPVYGGSVYSALYLAVNEHNRRSRLSAAVDELETRRHLRRHVIKAVLKVMHARGVDDDAAFQILRREAMRARVSLESFCKQLVLEGDRANEANASAADYRAAMD